MKSNKIFVKVLYLVFLFILFKNFVCKTRAKFVNKENVKRISTWSSEIRQSYKLVIGHTSRND